MSNDQKNINEAPFPHELKRLVEACKYKPGWTIRLALPQAR